MKKHKKKGKKKKSKNMRKKFSATQADVETYLAENTFPRMRERLIAFQFGAPNEKS